MNLYVDATWFFSYKVLKSIRCKCTWTQFRGSFYCRESILVAHNSRLIVSVSQGLAMTLNMRACGLQGECRICMYVCCLEMIVGVEWETLEPRGGSKQTGPFPLLYETRTCAQ